VPLNKITQCWGGGGVPNTQCGGKKNKCMNEFFADLYEYWGLAYLDGFSNDMFNGNLYILIGIWMLSLSFVGMFIYYYVINHPRYNKWYHWFIVVLGLTAINFAIAYSNSYNGLFNLYEEQNVNLPYSTEFFIFSFINAIWSFVFSFVFSLVIKWGSRNCKITPF
jgi:hypothetical protein